MNALVVVHTEKCYLRDIGARCRRRNQELFSRIGQEIGNALRQGKKIYFIAEESKHPYQKGMFPDISQYGIHIEFITPDRHERQFLKAKKRMLEQGMTQAEIAGINYYCCINDMFCLLAGGEGDYTKADYENAAQEMGWTQEEFQEVFETRIEAIVRTELTDKV